MSGTGAQSGHRAGDLQRGVAARARSEDRIRRTRQQACAIQRPARTAIQRPQRASDSLFTRAAPLSQRPRAQPWRQHRPRCPPHRPPTRSWRNRGSAANTARAACERDRRKHTWGTHWRAAASARGTHAAVLRPRLLRRHQRRSRLLRAPGCCAGCAGAALSSSRSAQRGDAGALQRRDVVRHAAHPPLRRRRGTPDAPQRREDGGHGSRASQSPRASQTRGHWRPGRCRYRMALRALAQHRSRCQQLGREMRE
jgi:hypothetical protein